MEVQGLQKLLKNAEVRIIHDQTIGCTDYSNCMNCKTTDNPSYCSTCFSGFDGTTAPGSCSNHLNFLYIKYLVMINRKQLRYYNWDNAVSATATY